MPAPRKSRSTSKSTASASASAPAKSEIKGSGTAISSKVESTAKSAAPIEISHDAIAKRAYEIYASRGYAPGNPNEDWHEAERQLRAGL